MAIHRRLWLAIILIFPSLHLLYLAKNLLANLVVTNPNHPTTVIMYLVKLMHLFSIYHLPITKYTAKILSFLANILSFLANILMDKDLEYMVNILS